MTRRKIHLQANHFDAGHVVAWIHDSYPYLIAYQIVLLAGTLGVFAAFNEDLVALPWSAFWRDNYNLAVAVATAGYLCVIVPWFVIPAYHGLRIRPDIIPIREREGWSRRRMALAVHTIVALVAFLYIVAFLIVHARLQQFSSALGLLLIVPGITPVVGHVVKRLRARREPLDVGLADFPDSLKPQQGDVLNLNVGGLAPRLRVVNRGLIAWNEYVDRHGATSQHVAAALGAAFATTAMKSEWQKAIGRYGWLGIEHLREKLASRVQSAPDQLTFLPSTTRASWAAVDSLDPAICLMTDAEHPGALHLAARLRGKHKAIVRQLGLRRMIEANWSEEKIAAGLADAAFSSSADILVVSHVLYSNGLVLPIRNIVAQVRQAAPDCRIVVDGAHAVGQEPVDIPAIDSDYYVFSGHKWLYGPAALGVLVAGPRVAESQRALLEREVYESFAFRSDRNLMEPSSVALEPFIGLACSLHSTEAVGGEETLRGNVSRLRSVFQQEVSRSEHLMLCETGGLRPVDGIVNIQHKRSHLRKEELTLACDVLEKQSGVIVRVVDFPLSLRICLPFYLRSSDIATCVGALDAIIGRHGAI